MARENTVMIAENDADVRTLMTVSLTKAGYTLTVADSGSEALALVREASERVYVLDVGLPDVSGLDLCRALRADERTATRPVLLISSNSSPEDIAAGYAAGADDFLPKPFSPRELAHRVGMLLAKSGGNPE